MDSCRGSFQFGFNLGAARLHLLHCYFCLCIRSKKKINTFHIAKFIFCYHNNLLPPLFSTCCFTNSQTHGYSSRTAKNYRVHHCRTNLKNFTILYKGPKIWNSLPVQNTSLSSFLNFKKKLLEFLVKQLLKWQSRHCSNIDVTLLLCMRWPQL